jgi:ATP-dependent Lon protease
MTIPINDNLPKVLPILPLRNNVLFPGVVIPISVGREKSIKAVKKAYKDNKYIGVIAQRDTKIEEPEPGDLYNIGCTAKIIKMFRCLMVEARYFTRCANVLSCKTKCNFTDPIIEG